MRDLTHERELALSYAVTLTGSRYYTGGKEANHQIITTANVIFGWLLGPVALLIAAGPTVDQTTGQHTGNPGGTAMVAMKDTEMFELTVTATDAKGQTTASPTNVTFTAADTNVTTITGPDAGGKTWAVAGNPGSTIITGDWPDSPSGDIQGTLAVDVTAGDAVSLAISAGTPVAQ